MGFRIFPEYLRRIKTYQVQDGTSHDGIEGGCAGEVEQAVEATETYGQGCRANGEVLGDTDVGKELGEG